ncbi:polyprenyl synthetase family protein [Streptomyces sp. NPDC047082]|uniref:polyprenyl synthetase family protein n=1 Tax=Streptomyces sp. NPDC047082 TaxID=3155259 RepID=UPI0033CFEE9A
MLTEACAAALDPPGKLLRPLLLVHSALAVGGVLEQVVPAAAGLECAHAGSLVHDDLIDRDAVRRGRAAVHARFGPGTAVVAGNSLFFAWFDALAECADRGVPASRIVTAMRVQARAGREACEGAARELAQTGDLGIPVEAYLEMARLKTAVLFSAACRIGAALAGAGECEAAALAGYGEALGIAFQIRDDLLPYTGGLSGKPSDSDLRNQRPTLPVLLARDHAGPAQREQLARAFTTPPDERTGNRMRELVAATGALHTAAELAQEHIRRALAHLDALRETPARNRLRAIAVDRTAECRSGTDDPASGTRT